MHESRIFGDSVKNLKQLTTNFMFAILADFYKLFVIKTNGYMFLLRKRF